MRKIALFWWCLLGGNGDHGGDGLFQRIGRKPGIDARGSTNRPWLNYGLTRSVTKIHSIEDEG